MRVTPETLIKSETERDSQRQGQRNSGRKGYGKTETEKERQTRQGRERL